MASAAVERPTDYQRAYEVAVEAIRLFDQASEALSRRTDRLVALQQERTAQKIGALVRLCQQPHPASAGKTYSLSQAEDVLQLDPDYAAYKARVAVAESEVRQAEDAKQSALLTAQLCIAGAKAVGGLT
jgi:hypothetical protein